MNAAEGGAATRIALLTAGLLIHEGRGVEAIAILEGTGKLAPAVESTRLRYLALAHTQQRRPAAAIELLDDAQTIAAQHGTADDHVWITSARAGAHLQAGAPAEAARLLEEAVTLCEQGAVVDTVLHFRLLADLGEARAQAGETAAALEALDRSITMSQPYADAVSRATQYAALAEAQLAAGRTESADYYSRKSVYLREDLRMEEGMTRARTAAAELRSQAGAER